MTLFDYLKNRIKLSDGQYITYDELAEWPAEEVEDAKQKGYLVQIDDADGIMCRQCPEHCWQTVDIRQKNGKPAGVFYCEHEDNAGLISVDPKSLQRWEIVQQKPKRRKRRLKVKKPKATTSFKLWDKKDPACFVLDKNKIKFFYKDEVKEIPFQKGSQAPLLIEAFIGGSHTGQEIQKMLNSKSSPSQIVRNSNRAINTQLRKIGFTDINKIGFVFFNNEHSYYDLLPKIIEKEDFEEFLEALK